MFAILRYTPRMYAQYIDHSMALFYAPLPPSPRTDAPVNVSARQAAAVVAVHGAHTRIYSLR